MIKITEIAKSALIDYSKKLDKADSLILKISIVGGGCSGLSYNLEFVQSDPEGVILFKEEQISIITDKKSALFISDLEIDYSGGLNGTGFVFKNPKAKRSCGCGLSFST